ncbi:rhodanese-like domain-containing protein [Clostridium septicum]|uniref:Rhodanese-like domain-containing protein n=1 Tax=Clostridium septicum TaxID=1504 RepID=A0A9N7PIC3_CLOSE|nr:rhodanese-like domain-containing protein [Clostridium septicum]AYE33581.1 rhodanese-like domain-containing protein [Clostridium septicum]MDU1312876.1 rhodanese-like domain-containing protein [Clostridium septicum]QAS61745.1 rhodanese-like domain-containing protein [Clostridium septicum]UEC21808.1 rhodanese-like domain-containing protein [Clostridium septicum]USS00140.1 rhodanese-like domain-containing protein [Clostridium septicum]
MQFTKSISNIQAENLIKEDKELLILDVRRFTEFKENRIPNAINIPVDDLEWEMETLENHKDNPILVYCKVGMRSSVACDILENEGFTKLYNLRGGILDYTGAIEK